MEKWEAESLAQACGYIYIRVWMEDILQMPHVYPDRESIIKHLDQGLKNAEREVNRVSEKYQKPSSALEHI